MVSKLKWYSKQIWRVLHGDVKDNDEFLIATYPIHDGQNVHHCPIVNNEAEAMKALKDENAKKPS